MGGSWGGVGRAVFVGCAEDQGHQISLTGAGAMTHRTTVECLDALPLMIHWRLEGNHALLFLRSLFQPYVSTPLLCL